MATTDFLPVAVATGANVDTQADFAGSSYQQNGFSNGLAIPSQANKIWRQASMIGATVANFIMNQLGVNVPDDGNLATLIANFTLAIPPAASAGSLTQTTPAFGNNTTRVATTAFVQAAVSPVSTIVTANTSAISTLNGEVSTINGEISTINGEISTINSEISTLNSEVAAIVSRGPLVGPDAYGSYYYEFSDGVLEQWGISTAVPSSGLSSVAITFPHAFTSTGTVNVQVGLTNRVTTGSDSGAGAYAQLSSLSTAGITILTEIDTGAGSVQVWWRAIGK